MSDTNQGPGWWQATDGKWYPPAPAGGPGPAPSQYCTNCAAPVAVGASACISCGFNPVAQRTYCGACSAPTALGQVVCTSCGRAVGGGSPYATGGSAPYGSKSKVAAGLLGIMLGSFGAHKFYLGRTNAALIMLGVSLAGICTGIFLLIPLFAWSAMSVIGIVEGIIYLTKSDQEFYEEYVVSEKDWF